ncbi:MAG TPA: hypothetical protein GXX67_00390 [Petrimonas sp.]|jgi:hypothetical protein|nr:hypothetical protein [Petrimonas sp.]
MIILNIKGSIHRNVKEYNNRMKNKIILWIASALLLFAGCINDEIVEEQPTPEVEGGTLVITASMPDESPQTRVNLAPEAGTKNIVVTWKAGDVIRFYFKQGENFSPTSTSVTLIAENISGDGKSATFTVTVPADINSAAEFTVYAVHGANSKLEGGIVLINVSPGAFTPLNQLQDVPISGSVDVTPGNPINISFNHLGTLQCLTVKNTSATDFTFTPSLVNEGVTDWYYTATAGAIPYFRLTGTDAGTVANYNEDFTPPASTPITLGQNSEIELAQWVRPKADLYVPKIKLNAQPPVGNTIVSVNSKPQRTSYMQQGRAYHLYALWDGNYLYFADDTFTPPAINPLSYVAKYNINPDGDGFVTDPIACNVSGYFNFDDAGTNFSDITIDNVRYHLPSIEEWQAIVYHAWGPINFKNANSSDNYNENAIVNGSPVTFTSDFRGNGDGISYALRYKGIANMLSAWRYEYVSSGNNTHMKITSRSLPYGSDITVEEIAIPEYWNANSENDVVRYFPASGYRYSDGGSTSNVGRVGCFWSSTQVKSMYFSDTAAHSSLGTNKGLGHSVRLFISDN